jgi:F-type H+-transporting ATPase subunit delta
MSDVAIGARYAQAFFELTSGAGEGESFAQLLEQVATAYQTSHELRSVLSNPVISLDKREAVLSAVISALASQNPGATDKSGPDLIRRSLLVMLRRGRISALSEAAQALRELVDTAAGVLRGEVITAVAMPEAFFSDLERNLSGQGRRVVLERKLDPALVGGVITRVDGQTIDQSIRGQLDRIERELLSSLAFGAAQNSAAAVNP